MLHNFYRSPRGPEQLKWLHIIIILLAIIPASCKKGGPDLNGSVRVKHLTSVDDVSNTLSQFVQGYQLITPQHFRDDGSYPTGNYVYNYSIGWEKNLTGDTYDLHYISVETAADNASKEAILAGLTDARVVNDDRLGKPPYKNVFATRKINFTKRDWSFKMYILLSDAKQQDQVIMLGGGYYPASEVNESLAPEPMSEEKAVSYMLSLTEAINK